MKREEVSKQNTGYLNWLVSKGCRFYAPMDQQHGLNELIQGWMPSIRADQSVTWDSNKRAYFLTSSNNNYATMMWTGKTIQPENVGRKVADAVTYTLLCDFNYTADNASYEACFMCGGSDNYHIALSGTASSRNTLDYSCEYFYTRNGYQCPLDQWHTYAFRRNTGLMNRISMDTGNVQVIETEENYTWALVYNQNMDTHISLMNYCAGYVRNLYIFDTYLSNDDLVAIHSHDHQ